MKRKTLSILALICLAMGIPLWSGCGGPEVAPVTGQIKLEGEPIPGALVAFYPLDAGPGRRVISAVTDEEGRFQLTFRRSGDGAPPGRYAVTAVWREPQEDGDEVLRTGPNMLPARYAAPETSGLTVTISSGANDLEPFELTEEP